MSEFINCPNCSIEIKSSLRSKVEILDNKKVGVINLYKDIKKEAYCSKCGEDLYHESNKQWLEEMKVL